MDNEERDLPQRDSDLLHQMCGIGQYELLPKGLAEKYWDLKRICDRAGIGNPVPIASLATLVFLHGNGKATAKEKQPPTLVDLWRRKEIKAGDTLIATFRKKDHEVKLLGLNARTKELQLQFEDGEERELPADAVRLPELATV